MKRKGEPGFRTLPQASSGSESRLGVPLIRTRYSIVIKHCSTRATQVCEKPSNLKILSKKLHSIICLRHVHLKSNPTLVPSIKSLEFFKNGKSNASVIPYQPTRGECTLERGNDSRENGFKSVGNHFFVYFENNIAEADGSIMGVGCGVFDLGYKGYMGEIHGLWNIPRSQHFLYSSHNIRFNHIPVFLIEEGLKPIRTWCYPISYTFHSTPNIFFIRDSHKEFIISWVHTRVEKGLNVMVWTLVSGIQKFFKVLSERVPYFMRVSEKRIIGVLFSSKKMILPPHHSACMEVFLIMVTQLYLVTSGFMFPVALLFDPEFFQRFENLSKFQGVLISNGEIGKVIKLF